MLGRDARWRSLERVRKLRQLLDAVTNAILPGSRRANFTNGADRFVGIAVAGLPAHCETFWTSPLAYSHQWVYVLY
jgi:hypothetical protein